MNAPQVHLMLNHVPVIGVLFAALALGVGLVWRNVAILRLGLAILVLVALAAVPVYFSGEPTEEHVEHLAGVSESTIEAHEDMAKAAMISMAVLGLAALVALLRYRRQSVPPRLAGLLLVAVLALSGALAWTAHLGGRIRHPELSGAATNASGAAPSERAAEDRD